MALCKINLFAQLADDVNVSIGYDTGKGSQDDILADTVGDAAVYHFEKFRWIAYPFGDEADDILVTLPVRRRHIVADTDVAALQGGIKLAKLADALRIQVRDAAVVLTELLDDICRHIAAADKILQQAGRYPLRILHVALLSGQLLDEVGVDQF